jgi:hypothetical protein
MGLHAEHQHGVFNVHLAEGQIRTKINNVEHVWTSVDGELLFVENFYDKGTSEIDPKDCLRFGLIDRGRRELYIVKVPLDTVCGCILAAQLFEVAPNQLFRVNTKPGEKSVKAAKATITTSFKVVDGIWEYIQSDTYDEFAFKGPNLEATRAIARDLIARHPAQPKQQDQAQLQPTLRKETRPAPSQQQQRPPVQNAQVGQPPAPKPEEFRETAARHTNERAEQRDKEGGAAKQQLTPEEKRLNGVRKISDMLDEFPARRKDQLTKWALDTFQVKSIEEMSFADLVKLNDQIKPFYEDEVKGGK